MREFEPIPIPGIERYAINRRGQVKGPTGIILKPMVRGKYYAYKLNNLVLKADKHYPAHRLCIITFKGYPSDERNQVNHIDHNKFNNNIKNLEWVTGKENIQKAVIAGKFLNRKGWVRNETQIAKTVDISRKRVLITHDGGSEIVFDSLASAAEFFGITIQRLWQIRRKSGVRNGYKIIVFPDKRKHVLQSCN